MTTPLDDFVFETILNCIIAGRLAQSPHNLYTNSIVESLTTFSRSFRIASEYVHITTR
jgi:hypothetical protein